MRLILILAACSVVLAACDAPGLRLRPDYMGRSLLEPNLEPRAVPHDAQGNPIVTPPPPLREPAAWPVFRGP